ncbi:unnamed protein product [Porites evermanni]|uniref:Secreted protein n=1 Tax=Porites evermanni TaxID=104178 RepID=A0ABN8M0M2_9CNID|nr:unnamed protein product [Porites evermanni]
MKRSVSKGVIFCLAVTLLICGVQGEESSCFGSYEHASKILCDPNSLCSLSDSAISCYCNTGYQGDATKFGSGCVSEGSKMLVEKRDADPEPYVPGMWTPRGKVR